VKVNPGEKLQNLIQSLRFELRNERIRWTSPDNIHITLAFLGDTEEKVIPEISQMLHSQCSGISHFGADIKGIGVFRSISDPKVLWTGLEKSTTLIRMNELIVQGLQKTGINYSEKLFNPHITLGRIKHLAEKDFLIKLIDKYKNQVIQHVDVKEVIVYESILLKEGPIYKPLAKIPLIV